MNAQDTPVRRGRPSRVESQSVEKPVEKENDPVSPQHVGRLKEKAEHEKRRDQNRIVEKFYELRGTPSGNKLSLCRKKKNGSIYRTYIGNIKNASVERYYKKIKEEGKLEIRQV